MMPAEERVVDALYRIAEVLQKIQIEVDHRLSAISFHLEDINSNLREIAKVMPSPMDHE